MARILPLSFVEKPWGRLHWPPPFPDFEDKRIGEAWFDPPGEMSDLLIKYIFTSEPLSVQVHPSDAQTQARGIGRQGKEECWLVVDAQPGARMAIGFREDLPPAQVEQAILAGNVEDLLAWHPVTPGAFFYIPANTVHAIGAGIGLIEIQQNSDITYRLYDYGRPRELHLEEGMAVARCGTYPDHHRQHLTFDRSMILCDGPYFSLTYLADAAFTAAAAVRAGPALIIPLTPGIVLDGTPLTPGQCGLVDRLVGGPEALVLGLGASCLIAQSCAHR